MFNTRRYLVLTEKFPPRKGGSNLWYDEVYRRIGDKNTHIVTCDQPGASEYDTNHANTIHRLVLDRHWWLRPESLGIYAKLLAKALVLVRKYRFDAVHAGRALSEGFIGLIVARIAGLPLTVYCHGEEVTTWRTPAKFRFMRFVYRRADQIIANSDFTKRELGRIGIDESKVAEISPGVDLDRFKPGLGCEDLKQSIGLAEDEKLILSVGRLTRRKGFDYLVSSLPKLSAAGILARLAIVGVGEDRQYLTELATKLHVGERVHLLGHVAPEDLPRWYNAADVFAMPNREINGDTEGFGMVFLEAAACGKPAIAGDAGGTGAAVLDGITGLRVDASSADSVFSSLKKILENPDLALALGRAAYDRARERFSWSRVADQTVTSTCRGF